MAKVTRGEVKGAIVVASANPGNTEALANAVRLSLDLFAQENPGGAVELRVPPFRVVQLLEGINHRRGTPPAVVEIAPQVWLKLISKKITWSEADQDGLIQASGEQSDLAKLIDSF